MKSQYNSAWLWPVSISPPPEILAYQQSRPGWQQYAQNNILWPLWWSICTRFDCTMTVQIEAAIKNHMETRWWYAQDFTRPRPAPSRNTGIQDKWPRSWLWTYSRHPRRPIKVWKSWWERDLWLTPACWNRSTIASLRTRTCQVGTESTLTHRGFDDWLTSIGAPNFAMRVQRTSTQFTEVDNWCACRDGSHGVEPSVNKLYFWSPQRVSESRFSKSLLAWARIYQQWPWHTAVSLHCCFCFRDQYLSIHLCH